MAKLDNMVRFMPDVLEPNNNPNTRGLLSAWATEDDEVVAQIQAAKDQIYPITAEGKFLDLLGSNVGVFRNPDFKLVDSVFRQLIPALSFNPKQTRETIVEVLDIFFGVGNTLVFEVNPSEIVIQIPSTIPGQRNLAGAFHLNSYSGTVTTIDNVFKTITVDFDDSTQSIQVDELSNALFGQILENKTIISNTAGTTGVVLQFSAGDDLSVFSGTGDFIAAVLDYQGSYMHDPTSAFTLRSLRGKLNQTITAGQSFLFLQMVDSSQIPNETGKFILNYGTDTQEGPIDYFSRPNNSSIFIDSSFVFASNHVANEPINVAAVPTVAPNIDGTDYSIYLSDVVSSITLAQQIIRSIVAAGVVVRFIQV